MCRQAKAALERLTIKTENSGAVPVVLSYAPAPGDPPSVAEHSDALKLWFEGAICRSDKVRICVDAMAHVGHPDRLRAAVAEAVQQAVAKYAKLPSTAP